MRERFLRNRDIIPQEKLDALSVIGLGGIGSAVIMLGSIMGFPKIEGWDHDDMAEHNLSTTVYPLSSVGHPKAIIASQVAIKYGCVEPAMHKRLWETGKPLHPKVIMCTDNMESRKDIFNQWAGMNNREFIIDARMGAMTCEIITITKGDEEGYMKTWQPSSAIDDEPCTAKHTIFTANIVAGLSLAQMQRVLIKSPYQRHVKFMIDAMTIESTEQMLQI